jgi:hypothetical protein
MFSPPDRCTPVVLHKADQPDSGMDLFDADGLTGEAGPSLPLKAKRQRCTMLPCA